MSEETKRPVTVLTLRITFDEDHAVEMYMDGRLTNATWEHIKAIYSLLRPEDTHFGGIEL